MTPSKTHKSAVVIIPPEELWEPIQMIRRKYDRQIRRWMPHITLIYPFRPREAFDTVAPDINQRCRNIEPFFIELARFNYFHHSRDRYTLWLAPEPKEPVIQLQESIWRVVPDCEQVRRLGNGFIPHLSVGQVTGKKRLQALLAELQADWRPLRFTVDRVSLIWREDPPNDVFRVDRLVHLGSTHDR